MPYKKQSDMYIKVLIDTVAASTEFQKKDVTKIVNGFLAVLVQCMRKGYVINIGTLGKFELVEKSPLTVKRKLSMFSPRYRVIFKESQKLKNMLLLSKIWETNTPPWERE